MARIRTIKPEFFRHESLQDLESDNPGHHVMLVFAGLWGHCDKAGRFEWKPRTLKLDILPFLDFDMAYSLKLLWEEGFVRRYQSEGKDYGEVVSFEKHQRISGKEAQEPEKYPEPNEYISVSNGEAIGKQSGLQEGKGKGREEEREGKGREKEGNTENDSLRERREQVAAVFDCWRKTMNHERAALDSKRKKLIEARIKDGYNAEALCNAVIGCSLSPFHMGDNDKGQKYDGLELILRDAGKVDQFIGFYENPPRPKPEVKTVAQERAETIAGLTGRSVPMQKNLNIIEGESRNVGA